MVSGERVRSEAQTSQRTNLTKKLRPNYKQKSPTQE